MEGRSMILAYHSILAFYGFWLPNDPRGSGSDYVASWELFRYGRATKTDSPRSVAHVPHDHRLRQQAKLALQHPPVEITGRQAVVVAQGFREAMQEAGYAIHALAILPEHIHLVIARPDRAIRVVIGHLRSKATAALHAQGLWDDRPLWGEHGWNVKLESVEAVRRGIAYAENNPEKEGMPRQHWGLVTPFDPGVALPAIRSARAPKSRQIGGAALKSHQDRLAREQRLELELRSKPTNEIE